MQQEIDSAEYAELLAYDLYVEPFGQEWRRTATLCATVRGLFDRDAKPEQHMPLLDAAPAVSDVKQQLLAFAKRHNALMAQKKKT